MHPLVIQLRFTRSEFQRALAGLSDEDARKRLLPMNCISWNVGHLAWHEQRTWLWYGQGLMPYPEIHRLFAYGAPASTPPLDEMLAAWETIARLADPWLDELTSARLLEPIARPDRSEPFTFGNQLRRITYHYWYHTGENCAIRQALGHTDLPQFVGDIDSEAPYVAEYK